MYSSILSYFILICLSISLPTQVFGDAEIIAKRIQARCDGGPDHWKKWETAIECIKADPDAQEMVEIYLHCLPEELKGKSVMEKLEIACEDVEKATEVAMEMMECRKNRREELGIEPDSEKRKAIFHRCKEEAGL